MWHANADTVQSDCRMLQNMIPHPCNQRCDSPALSSSKISHVVGRKIYGLDSILGERRKGELDTRADCTAEEALYFSNMCVNLAEQGSEYLPSHQNSHSPKDAHDTMKTGLLRDRYLHFQPHALARKISKAQTDFTKRSGRSVGFKRCPRMGSNSQPIVPCTMSRLLWPFWLHVAPVKT